MSALADVTQTNFENEVLKNDQPVLVDFWAPWFGPCRMLSPVVEKIAAANTGCWFFKTSESKLPSVTSGNALMGLQTLL